MVRVHFTDYFEVEPEALEEYGAFNISLINDLPLFIDPFLLFNSERPEYQRLHDSIIQYLRFLRDKSTDGPIRPGLVDAWFRFPEVKQNWFGYSLVGNSGTGLGQKFADSLNRNLSDVFSNFGDEEIARASHLEKLCLIEDGVGRDSISDFTTNLIKESLLEYTERFAIEHIDPTLRRTVPVPRVRFDYDTEVWVPRSFDLPFVDGDYVVLTPRDILTKDDVWISRNDLVGDFQSVVSSIPNAQLRGHMNGHFLRSLPMKPKKGDRTQAILSVIDRFPEYIEYFIKYKEDRGEEATARSDLKVSETEAMFVEKLSEFAEVLAAETRFYQVPADTKEEARERVEYLKDVIENKGGHRVFWASGKPIRREFDLHVLFRLTWFGTPSDVTAEANDGRGPADFKISRGAWDKTILEFKLASNTALERNLQKQAPIYQKASDAKHALKVIVFFTRRDENRVRRILRKLGMEDDPDVILIDGRTDNKPSASKA